MNGERGEAGSVSLTVAGQLRRSKSVVNTLMSREYKHYLER